MFCFKTSVYRKFLLKNNSEKKKKQKKKILTDLKTSDGIKKDLLHKKTMICGYCCFTVKKFNIWVNKEVKRQKNVGKNEAVSFFRLKSL